MVTPTILWSSEVFEIKVGEQVRVISDQAFRMTSENYFEAVGNVIITHLTNAIYGEKATLEFESGEAEVLGNVRYVGPSMTLHGSRLVYNFKTGYLSAYNARIISDNYTMVGTQIERVEPGVVVAKDAEYTTCRDCPESWSVFGKHVRIILGEYIYITHAYLKMKGVVMMYIPYMVLPIKKNRETGFLFPNFGVRLSEGVRFQQPWFWAISDSNDLTLSPTLWGKRGLLNQFEYRHALGQGKWFKFHSTQALDRIYEPYKLEQEVSGTTTLRHFSDYEHHYTAGNWFNHHLFGNFSRDLDIVRDFEELNNERLIGPEMGVQGFFNIRFPTFDLNIESHFFQNQLVENPRDFDHSYVQMLPRVSVTQNPVSLFQTGLPVIGRLSVGGHYEYTYFKQNHYEEQQLIRNAHRFHAAPFIDWQLGFLGPFQVQTRATWDVQSYRFPYEDKRSFNKRGIVYETEISLELEKFFGLSYKDKVDLRDINLAELTDEEREALIDQRDQERLVALSQNLVGEFPGDIYELDEGSVEISQYGYRHGQEFKLKHYYLGAQSTQGNQRFLEQIQSSRGQFDILDAIRAQQSLVNDGTSRTDIPLSNTIELQWNNSLLRKSAKDFDPFEDKRFLRDNFTYSQTAYFNISQGLDLSVDSEEELKNRLTRLFVGTGFTIEGYRFSISDYYFWATDNHLFNTSISKSFGDLRLSGGVNYNAFNRPVYKSFIGSANLKLNDLIQLRSRIDYDIALKATNRTEYGLTYSPANNCWMLDLSYSTTQIDKSVSFNIFINFNDGNFAAMGGGGQ